MPLIKHTSTLITLFVLLGAGVWAWKNEIIIIRLGGLSGHSLVKNATTKKPITLFYHLNDTWHSETVDSLWSNNPVNMLIFTLNNWLTFLDEEKIMPHKVSVQSVILSSTGTEALVSLDRNPFHAQENSYTKLIWMEALLKTIRANNIPISQLRLLIKHTPLTDQHIDFNFSWPVHGFLSDIVPPKTSISSSDMLTSSGHNKFFTIMIAPTGDAQKTGRTILDTYERTITLKSAQKIKNMIETSFSSTRVILTRDAGEIIEPLQNINFANRLHPDLYITLHFYHEQENAPSLFIYQYVKDPTDMWPKNVSLTNFIPFDQAHLVSSNKTNIIRNMFVSSLKQACPVDIKSLAIPFSPLKGILSPAIGIEIGLKKSSDSELYLSPLVNAITSIIFRKE